MSKTPTVEEFAMKHHIGGTSVFKVTPKEFKEALVEFARLHLEAQTKAIVENAKVSLAKDWVRKEETIHPNSLVSSITIKVDEQSILNAYPLDNIK